MEPAPPYASMPAKMIKNVDSFADGTSEFNSNVINNQFHQLNNWPNNHSKLMNYSKLNNLIKLNYSEMINAHDSTSCINNNPNEYFHLEKQENLPKKSHSTIKNIKHQLESEKALVCKWFHLVLVLKTTFFVLLLRLIKVANGVKNAKRNNLILTSYFNVYLIKKSKSKRMLSKILVNLFLVIVENYLSIETMIPMKLLIKIIHNNLHH